METKTFTPEKLIEALESGEFDRKSAIIVGMVKQSEKKDHISFTSQGCEQWIDLPIEMIESADHLGSRACKDHVHPLMKVRLKQPTDQGSSVLWSLLSAMTAKQINVSAVARPQERAGVPPMARSPRAMAMRGHAALSSAGIQGRYPSRGGQGLRGVPLRDLLPNNRNYLISESIGFDGCPCIADQTGRCADGCWDCYPGDDDETGCVCDCSNCCVA